MRRYSAKAYARGEIRTLTGLPPADFEFPKMAHSARIGFRAKIPNSNLNTMLGKKARNSRAFALCTVRMVRTLFNHN